MDINQARILFCLEMLRVQAKPRRVGVRNQHYDPIVDSIEYDLCTRFSDLQQLLIFSINCLSVVLVKLKWLYAIDWNNYLLLQVSNHWHARMASRFRQMTAPCMLLLFIVQSNDSTMKLWNHFSSNLFGHRRSFVIFENVFGRYVCETAANRILRFVQHPAGVYHCSVFHQVINFNSWSNFVSHSVISKW